MSYHAYTKQKITLAAISADAEYEALKAAQIETNLGDDAVNAVKAFTNLIDELISAMRDKLTKLQLISTNTTLPRFESLAKEDQLNFYYDFFNLTDIQEWDKLNEIYDISTQRTLVDDWSEIIYKKIYRKDIEFLNAYRFLRVDSKFITHVVRGEITASGKVKGLHSILAEQTGGRIDSVIIPADLDGFYAASVSKADVNGVYHSKMDSNGIAYVNDMFPDDWDSVQRITEEIAYVFNHKRFILGTRDQYEATLTNGRKCILCIFGNTAKFDNTTKMVTAWPVQ